MSTLEGRKTGGPSPRPPLTNSCYVIWDEFNIVVRHIVVSMRLVWSSQTNIILQHACVLKDVVYHKDLLVWNYKTTVYERWVWWGTVADWQFPLVSYLRWTFPLGLLLEMDSSPWSLTWDGHFPLVSYLRWTFPAERLRKMFLQNTPWMPIRTLRYIITPEGQSWRRFLATQFTLIFEVEVFL